MRTFLKTVAASLAIFSINAQSANSADLASTLDLTSGEVVAWGGDSITSAQMCAVYEAAWMQLTYPNLDLKTYVIGRSGSQLGGWATADPVPPDSSSVGLWERYHAPLNADVVLTMFGQNGTGVAATHGQHYEDLWTRWVEPIGAKLVVLGMHPAQGTSDNKYAEAKTAAEAAFAATEADVYASDAFARIGAPWLANGNNNLVDIQQIGAEPFTTSGVVPNDGDARIHPGPAGHIAIAWAHLKGLDVDTLVSSATLAANTNTITDSEQCTVSGMAMTSTGGTFSRLDNRLPWAIDEAGRANAYTFIPDIEGWQEYSITITGLSAGNYTIKCDGVVIGTATHTELAAGWNMADLTAGPVWQQCQEVLGEFRDLAGFNRSTGDALSPMPNGTIGKYISNTNAYYQNGDQRGATYVASMAPAVALFSANMAEIHADAQPVNRAYSIEGETGSAPVLTITAPSGPATVDDGDTVSLTATATDTEDGNIAADVSWVDSLDGALGSGASVNPVLTVGFHTITATVVDSDGNTSVQSVNVTVESTTVVSEYVPPIGIPAPMFGSFDPISSPQPDPPSGWPATPVTNNYYIDNTHPSATDTSNTYGTPNVPRLTIPEITYAAGSRIEIHGGPYVRRSGDKEHDFVFSGTESSPCWIVGHDIDNPPMLSGAFEVSGTYAVFTGIKFVRDTDAAMNVGPSVNAGGDSNSATSFICFRNSVADGGGYEQSGSASTCFNVEGSSGDEVHHVVFHNMSVVNYGNLEYTQTVLYSDDHAFRPALYTHDIWLLDSSVSNVAGDAIQITGNNASGEARAQRIYVGGNNFSLTGENAVDVKSSLDVIVSSNKFHNFPGGLGGSGTAVVVQQEGGSGFDNVWILFNEISDCFEAVRTEEIGTNCNVIGNVVYDIYSQSGNSAFRTRTSGTQTSFVDNTVHGLGAGVHAVSWDGQGGNAPDLQIHGNLFSGKTDDAAFWYDGDATAVSRSSDRNVFDSSNQFRVAWEGSSYTTLGSFQSGKSEDINSVLGSPNFTDVEAKNFTPIGYTSARNTNREHAAYAAFETRYSIDIRYDYLGNPRPASGIWDSGAIQAGNAWNYVGVPYTDWAYDPFTKPAPTAPAEWPAAEHAGYYFVEQDHPSATDTANGSDTTDANGLRYGYPNRPRLTLPTSSNTGTTYAAGSVIWLKGGVWNDHYSNFSVWQGVWNGTEEDPCWIYGDPSDPPTFSDLRISLADDSHVFVQGIVWDAGTTLYPSALTVYEGSHHITVRHCRIQNRDYDPSPGIHHGSHIAVDTGAVPITDDVHDVVFYDITYKNNGGGVNWNNKDADYHGFKLNGTWGGGRAYRLWVVDCKVEKGDTIPEPLIAYASRPATYDVNGDSTIDADGADNVKGTYDDEDLYGSPPITEAGWTSHAANGDGLYKSLGGNFAQIGDQQASTGNVDHIYLAGNDCSGMRQGAIGFKRAGFGIVSSNFIHDLALLEVGEAGATSQGQAFNTKYDRGDNLWFINNHVKGTRSPFIRGSLNNADATHAPATASVYLVGNVFENFHQTPINSQDTSSSIGTAKTRGIGLHDRRGTIYIVNNTVNNADYGVITAGNTAGEEGKVYIYNNIFANLGSGYDPISGAGIAIFNDGGGEQYFIENNLTDSPAYRFESTTYTSTATWNARSDTAGNLDGDPLFVDDSASDFSVGSSSPAIDAGTDDLSLSSAPDVYQVFLDTFDSDPDFPGDPADVWPRDYLGEVRISGGSIDIGSHEYYSEESLSNGTITTGTATFGTLIVAPSP